jgi:hypothetical protein
MQSRERRIGGAVLTQSALPLLGFRNDCVVVSIHEDEVNDEQEDE